MAARFSGHPGSKGLGKLRHCPDNMSMNDTPEQRGFVFPGTLEISAMGAADAGLDALVIHTLESMKITWYADTLRSKPSTKGNYISVTVAFHAESREQYDAAHEALRALPEVKWTL
ncbi:MAG: YbeD family protein [Arenimonas sp.]